MALDFTTGVLDSRVTISRALNTATRTNSSGVIEIVNANLPRFDYNPVTLAARGLLIEETRTNLFLNSLINGTSLSTQSVTVTAVSHTISFYGTGTITLSGAATATVVGTGAYPNRQTLTFTPIVGVLVCTVSGSVQYAQLEVGAFATSFIPTATTSLTRNADAVSMTGTNFSSWYNATEGAFWFEFTPDLFLTSNINRVATVSQGAASGRVVDIFTSGGNWNSYNGTTTIVSGASVVTNVKQRIVATYKTGSYALALNGVTPSTAASALVNAANQMAIGSLGGSNYLNGHIQRISYWPQRITNAETQAFSKQ
jgi:hypothetical protein